MLGRDFVATDEAGDGAPVAILSHRFWDSRFGKRADIVGSIVHINGTPVTIIGVMPERFEFPTRDDLWMPLPGASLPQRGITPGGFMSVARLADGVSLDEARVEIETINRRLEAAYPATNRGVVATVATHSQTMSGRDAPIVWGSLWAAAWFVLLIACANLANLMLVRTVGRWRDFSTRLALGAGQWRIVRQMLLECLILAAIAGTLGWWLTNWTMRTWVELTASRYQILDYSVQARTLVYLVAITVGAAVLCAIAPILKVVQFAASGAPAIASRGATQDPRGKRLAAGLVAAQMTLAIVLLSGAGVLVRSFVNIVNAETGVRDPERILVGAMRLPADGYSIPASRRAYFDRVQTRLKAVPGIDDTTIASTLPVKSGVVRAFEIEGRPPSPAGETAVQYVRAGPEYFRVVGAAVTSGRVFTDTDDVTDVAVAIVNESFVAKYWPGEQPLGKRLRAVTGNTPGEWRTVVGVVPNIMQGEALRQQFAPLVYVPFQQEPPLRFAYFLLRTTVPPAQVAQAVLAELQALEPDVVMEDVESLKASFAFQRDFMDAEHSELGKHSKVAPVFAAIALLLSAVGLSAVIAHSVSQRTKEVGVRMAIGASARDVRWMILREGMAPVAIGIVVGLGAALASNRILQSQLVGVSPYDLATMGGAPIVLAIVALLACQMPARRAMRVDPVVALRHE
jgi:putative ABC transport system permease protein